MYSLELPLRGDSNENTQYAFRLNKIEKILIKGLSIICSRSILREKKDYNLTSLRYFLQYHMIN